MREDSQANRSVGGHLRATLQCFLFIVVAVSLAHGLRVVLLDRGGWEIWAGLQVTIVVVIAAGLVMTDPSGTIARDCRRCVLAWWIFVLLQTLGVMLALFGIVRARAVTWLAAASLDSLGWYPRGADAWFPISIALWMVSTLAVLIVSICVAHLLRRVLRQRSGGVSGFRK
jgi:hypothetical protein